MCDVDIPNDEFRTVSQGDGDLVAIGKPEFALHVSVLDEVGATVDPFGGGLAGENVENATVPIIEKGQDDLFSPIGIPLEDVAGKFPACQELSALMSADWEKHGRTSSCVLSDVKVPELRSVANEKGEDRVLSALISRRGQEAVEFVGRLPVSEHEMGPTYRCVVPRIGGRRVLDIDVIDAFNADDRHGTQSGVGSTTGREDWCYIEALVGSGPIDAPRNGQCDGGSLEYIVQ